ncbi:hypothetical protein PVW46_24590 [Mameliella sp. AT18]|nr:hypothetical protein [Mameliella sp. AT18]
MSRFPTGSAITCIALALTACSPPRTETVFVVPDVPEDLLTPVEVPARRVEVLTDVGLVLADHVEALELANDRIRGVRCVLEGTGCNEQ